MENRFTESLTLEPIAHIRTDFPEKFGVPRQSGRVPSLVGEIVFEEKYAAKEALRGIEGYSHLWLIWGFSLCPRSEWSPTVRPPRLGGNKRMGIFATRSPNRPNPIGLSAVKLREVRDSGRALSLIVEGADLVNGTPIYDIKPYLPFADSIEDAVGGFADEHENDRLTVDLPHELAARLPQDRVEALLGVLGDDPRPSYQNDGRSYGMSYAGHTVDFFVEGGVLHVTDIRKGEEK